MKAWRACDESRLSPRLREGLGAEPVYSVRDDSWYVKLAGETLRYGLGDASSFATAQVDLDNQVGGPIKIGDAALNAGQWSPAILAYKAAGQAGVLSLGPEIDRAGAPQVTAPHTLLAQGANATLSVITGTDQASAEQAQGLAYTILGHYQAAINAGKTASTNPPAPPPNPAPPAPAPAQAKPDYGPAVLIGGILGLGAIGWALWPR